MKKVLFAIIALPIACFSLSDEDFLKILRGLRQVDAHTVKSNVAQYDEQKPISNELTNGDEELYSDLRGSILERFLYD